MNSIKSPDVKLRVSRALMFSTASALALAFFIGGVQARADETDRTPDSAAENKDMAVEEIVVTATKRSIPLQKVAISVSAKMGEALRSMGATDFVGYARSIPGLSFSDTGVGSQKVSIRGIRPSVGSSAVAFYIGDTPLPASTGNFGNTLANPELIDINRIEVLRGPQGTLYGAGSVGGTIKLAPQQPNLIDFDGFINASLYTAKGGTGADISAATDIPLVQNKLGLRTAAWYRNSDGFITRKFARGEKKDIPHEETAGIRSIALFRPSEAIDLSAMVYHQTQEFNGFQDITGGASNPNDDLVQNFLLDVAEPSKNSFTLYNLTANITFDPIKLTSVTSYYTGRREIAEEGVAFINAILGGPPLENVMEEINKVKDLTQEVRLATTHSISGFDAIIGLYYDNNDGSRIMDYSPGGWNDQYAPNGPTDPLYSPNNNLFSLDDDSFAKETSIFGELSYAIGNAKLTGGLRRYHIKNGSDLVADGFFNGGLAVNNLRASFSGTVGKVNASYQVTDDHMIYTQFSEGFRPGFGIYVIPGLCDADLAALGFDTPPTQVNPDKVKSYEVGAKTSWLDNRIVLNASGYRMDWKDVQQGLFLPCGFTLITNSSNGARSYGFEIETTVRATKALSLGFSGSYTKSTFNNDEPVLGAREGDQLQDVPRWQFSVSTQYEFQILNNWSGYVRVDLQHTGVSYVDFTRILPDDVRDPLTKKKATTLLNARFSVMSGNWEFSAFGNNLLDDVERQSRAISSIVDTPGRPRYAVNEPRKLGLEIRRNF